MISDAQYQQYQRDGFLLLKGFLDTSVVNQLRLDAKAVFIQQLLAHGILTDPAPSESAFETAMVAFFQQDFQGFLNTGKTCQNLISTHRLSLSEAIVDTLPRLGVKTPIISTRPVLYFNTKALAKSEGYYKTAPHQDWRSMQGSLNAIVVWVPLTDVPSELGPLEVLPGSHKWGLLDSVPDDWFRQIEGQLPEKDFVSVPVELGDALFFSSFLVHRSGNNVTPKIRWSCHFRYNDLSEPHFIKRHYPSPYIYKPEQELITPNFPSKEDLKIVFKETSLPHA